MSFQNNPKYQIPELIQALKDHGLEHDTPSQLADAFRTGWLASQPKAPAPVPVVQGEAQIEAVCRELCRWDRLDPDEVLDSRPDGDKLMWHREEGRAKSILQAVAANMDVGAVGGVGAIPVASDEVQVVCITRGGSTLICRVSGLPGMFPEFGDGDYKIKFKTMSVLEYEALGDFDGF